MFIEMLRVRWYSLTGEYNESRATLYDAAFSSGCLGCIVTPTPLQWIKVIETAQFSHSQ